MMWNFLSGKGSKSSNAHNNTNQNETDNGGNPNVSPFATNNSQQQQQQGQQMAAPVGHSAMGTSFGNAPTDRQVTFQQQQIHPHPQHNPQQRPNYYHNQQEDPQHQQHQSANGGNVGNHQNTHHQHAVAVGTRNNSDDAALTMMNKEELDRQKEMKEREREIQRELQNALPPSDSTKTKVQIALEYTHQYYTHYLLTNNDAPPPAEALVVVEDGSSSSNGSNTTTASPTDQTSSFIRDHTRARTRKMSAEKDFTIIAMIGCGAFGEVYLCTFNADPLKTLLVMKRLHKGITMCRRQVMNVRAERDILVKAKDTEGKTSGGERPARNTSTPKPLPNLSLQDWAVDMYFSFQDDHYLYFILEYCAGGDLMTWLMEIDVFPEQLAQFYIAEIVLAIEALHRKGYAHRDVKPDNVLIDGNGHLKLTDFGLAKHIGGGLGGGNGLGPNVGSASDSASDTDDDEGEATRQTSQPASQNSRIRQTKEEKIAARRAEKKDRQQKAWGNAMGTGEGEFVDDYEDDEQMLQQRTKTHTDPNSTAFNKKSNSHHNRGHYDRGNGEFFTAVGSPGYMAPEVVVNKPSVRQALGLDGSGSPTGQPTPLRPYTTSCDWWAVGIILYEMMYGYVPFHTNEDSSVQMKIIQWQRYLEFPGYDRHATEPPPPTLPSPAAVDLMRKLICDSSTRIGFSDIIAHPFFKGVVWETLREQRPRPILSPKNPMTGQCHVIGYDAPPFVLKLANPTDTRYFDLAGVKQQQREQLKLHQQYHDAYTKKLEEAQKHQQMQLALLRNAAAATAAIASNPALQLQEQAHLQLQQQVALSQLYQQQQHAAASATEQVYQPSDKRYLFYGFTAKFGVGGKNIHNNKRDGDASASGGATSSTATQQRQTNSEALRDVMTGGAGTKGSKLARPALVQDFDEDED